ncbi:hypothetical protein [Pseudomonas rustica]|uniref:hypothetical protein n=1 Tax=Pseudomonas rustica TaxID=2827099 RepID=UPI001BAE679F|nr:hypothetical protein [Pseudomonas rustica]MBS4089985.1 hypothetical protein [Pseudomonas rustica]
MTTQPDQTAQDETPLANRPPTIVARTEMTDPEHYDGGIAIAALTRGLRVVINPWFNIAYDDLVEMFWGNSTHPVFRKIIDRADELTLGVPFDIHAGFIVEGEATPVFYRVTKLNQTPEDSTPVSTYLVKLTRPGGVDNDGEGNGNTGLKYYFTPDISGGVTSNIANRGVQMHIVPYENITRFDRIVARWGDQQVVHYPVTQEQITDPINHPIVLTFTKAIIEKAGNGERLPVSYQVIDRCGNYPDERDPWAKLTQVFVDLDDHRLDAPVALVAGQPVELIELDTLGEADVTVRVHVLSPDFAAGDTVRLTWTGTPAEGDPVIVGPVDKRVDGLPASLDFTIPNVMVKAIAKGWATVGYLRIRAGVADLPSKTASLNVKGEIPQLLAPSVKEANGTQLDPMKVQQKLVVMLPLGTLLPTDKVSVSWLAADGSPAAGSHTTLTRPVSESGIEIEIPVSVIAYNLGKTVTVIYSVTRGTAAPKDSLPLLLNVLPIAASEFKQPTIRVGEQNVEGPLLDVTDLADGAAVRIGVWPHIAVGQYVWLTLKGKDANGEQHDLSLWNQPSDASVNARWISDGYVDKPVPYNYLKSLGHNSELRIEFKASLIKNQEESTAQIFEMRIYTIKWTPTISWLRGSPSGQDIAPGGFTRETSVSLSGTANKGQQVDVLDGIDTKGQPIADAITGIWTLSIHDLSVSRHSLTATAMVAGGGTSKAWEFNVIDEMVIDRQPMNLNGLSVKMPDWPRTGKDSPGNTQIRQPTKGLPPYSYASSNPTVVSVTTEGKVTGNKNGNAIIVVFDMSGQSITYNVLVTNVYRLRISERPTIALQAVQWRESLADAELCSNQVIADLNLVYGEPLPVPASLWQCTTSGCGEKTFTYFHKSGYVGCLGESYELLGWCIQPI